MNKLLRKIVAVLMCISLFFCGLPAAFADTDWIEIDSVEVFLEFAEKCRLDSFSQGKTFRLTADIDLTNTDFDGIPIFCGTFDGAFHKISGLSIDAAGSVLGLFRYVQTGATVKNLTVEGDVSPVGSRQNVGGIVGSNGGNIENCTFLGSISGAENVGGIAGINLEGGTIHGCSTYGNVGGKHFVGGITGANNGLVENCINRSKVNTTALQNDTGLSDITLDSLLNSESQVTATDIGGIAGLSTGQIVGCKNWGSVGYQHMGYNVGGIVGLQSGYVANCENFGPVLGRKEVGGIVGQQEPEVRLHYSTDTLQILKEQVAELSLRIHEASDRVDANVAQIMNLLEKLGKYVTNIEKSIDKIEKIAEDPTLEDLRTILDLLESVQDSLAGIEKTLDSLADIIDKTATDLSADMDAISHQLAVIENTLNHAEDGVGGNFFDISDQDTAENLTSKVVNCRNYGSIQADLNAGGIVGAVTFENDLDPEGDVTVEGDLTLNAVGSVRSVILSCENFGEICVKLMYAGGIVGRVSIGLVKECTNTGTLANDTADYVGGIAGASDGFIRSCLVKCTVSGNQYVGGIAGFAGVATDCQSMASLAGTEKIGGILGNLSETRADVDEPVKDNLYLQMAQDFGGIDGISYSGMALGLCLADFLSLQAEDSIFRTVTVTFLADGIVVYQKEVPTGSTFDDVPAVPAKQGVSGHWAGLETADLDCVLFDLTIVAEYISHHTVIQSEQTSQDGRPILLLLGDFAIGASLTVTALQDIPNLHDGMQLLEGWVLHTEHCLSQHVGRLLIPGGADSELLAVLVRDKDGNWAHLDHRIDGSYIVFSMSEGEDAVALVQMPQKGLSTGAVILLSALGVLIAGAVTAICVSFFHRKARNAKHAEEMNA